MSLRLRLTLLFGGLLTISGLGLLTGTYLLVRHEVLSVDPQPATVKLDDPSRPPVPDVAAVRVTDRDGNTVAYSLDQLPQWLYQQQLNTRDRELASLLTRGAVSFVVVTALSMGTTGYVIGKVLRRLQHVSDAAESIAAATSLDQGLRVRVDDSEHPDEIGRLAATFNRMTDRLERSFAAQRRFAADASHELRTPLANARGVIELTMRQHPGNETVQTLGADVLVEHNRCESTLDALFTMSFAEQHVEQSEEVHLDEITRAALTRWAPVAADHSITITAELAPASCRGHAALLERLVDNIIENAIVHNHHGGTILVLTKSGGDAAEFEVANSGKIVDEGNLPELFEPFMTTRALGGREGAHGTGLGLTIVAAIARAHAATVAATANPAGGLTISVRFDRTP